jgi:hypothetical protein
MSSPVRCLVCADVVGVYEPALAFEGGGVVRCTSLAREPGLRNAAEGIAHAACGAALGGGRLSLPDCP